MSKPRSSATSRRPANRAAGTTPTVYVAQVSGTLKRGSFSAQLGPKTLIVGANGSGKTTICNAVTLALSGFAHDVAGKDMVTDDAAVWRHLATDGNPVHVDVTLSDGRRFSYHKEEGRKEDGAHLPGSATAAVFPMADLHAGLTGAPQTVRKWVLQAASRWMTADALRTAVTSYQYGDVITVPDGLDDVGLWLEQGLTAAESNKRAMQDKLRAASMSVDGLRTAAGLPVSDHEIEQARLRLDQLAVSANNAQTAHEREQWLIELNALTTQLDQVTADLHAAIAVESEARNAVVLWDAEIAKWPQPARPDATVLAGLQGFYDFVAAHRAHWQADQPCGLCGQSVESTAYLARLDAMIAQAHGVLHPADPTAEARQNKEQWQGLLRARTDTRAALEREQQSLTTRTQQAQSMVDRPVASTTATAYAEVRAQYDALVRRRGLHDQLATHAAGVAASDEALARMTRTIDAFKKVGESMLALSVSKLEQEVTRWLPEGEAFKVDIGQTHARVGLVIGGVFRSGLSGAEEARMYAAVCCALASGDIVVVMPSERQWSPEVLREVMRALEKAPGQVILVSTVEPAGRVGKAWTVVRPGDAYPSGAPVEDDSDSDADDTAVELARAQPAQGQVLPFPSAPVLAPSGIVPPPTQVPLPGMAPVQPAQPAVPAAPVAAVHPTSPPLPPSKPAWLPVVEGVQVGTGAAPSLQEGDAIEVYQDSNLTVWYRCADGAVYANTALGKWYYWRPTGGGA